MTDYPSFVKGKLLEIISKMAAEPKLFVKNPNVDFTRNQKLSFKTVLSLMLSMGGNSLTSELMEYFQYDVDMASSSAFVQQTNKLLPYAFEFLLNEFTRSFQDLKTMKAIDYLRLMVLI